MIELYVSVKNDHVSIVHDVKEENLVVLCRNTKKMKVFYENVESLFFEMAANITEETDFETACQFFKPVNI